MEEEEAEVPRGGSGPPARVRSIPGPDRPPASPRRPRSLHARAGAPSRHRVGDAGDASPTTFRSSEGRMGLICVGGGGGLTAETSDDPNHPPQVRSCASSPPPHPAGPASPTLLPARGRNVPRLLRSHASMLSSMLAEPAGALLVRARACPRVSVRRARSHPWMHGARSLARTCALRNASALCVCMRMRIWLPSFAGGGGDGEPCVR